MRLPDLKIGVSKMFHTGAGRELRRNMTRAEKIIWARSQRKQMCDYKFRRQYSVGSYIIDFYCPALKLAVEIDGDTHFQPGAQTYNRQRQSFIEGFGIRFLRFTNQQVYQDLERVLAAIRQTARQLSEL